MLQNESKDLDASVQPVQPPTISTISITTNGKYSVLYQSFLGRIIGGGGSSSSTFDMAPSLLGTVVRLARRADRLWLHRRTVSCASWEQLMLDSYQTHCLMVASKSLCRTTVPDGWIRASRELLCRVLSGRNERIGLYLSGTAIDRWDGTVCSLDALQKILSITSNVPVPSAADDSVWPQLTEPTKKVRHQSDPLTSWCCCLSVWCRIMAIFSWNSLLKFAYSYSRRAIFTIALTA